MKLSDERFWEEKAKVLARTAHQSEADVRSDLAGLRVQFMFWEPGDGHVYDGPDCILCGCFGPVDGAGPCLPLLRAK